MTTQEIIDLANNLGLEYYNDNIDYVCLKGINGHATVIYTNQVKFRNPSTLLDIASHLKQMGRDSLKMELANLLSITNHA